jgi:hypothetical protein
MANQESSRLAVMDTMKYLSILRNEDTSNLFREYIEGIHPVQNFFFWKEIERYKEEWTEYNQKKQSSKKSKKNAIS